MVGMSEAERQEFKKEWNAAVERLNKSRVDLSKIYIAEAKAERKKEKNNG